ncbi:hypothetical protein [Aeromicrobium sp. 179-A 4D2 NHS]|uniref:hypothetical protein n=1 Tax=Aeromicrobium sp. 179-A 4D2 NHS TaxID=3142375 RepID=UPI0039A1EB7C
MSNQNWYPYRETGIPLQHGVTHGDAAVIRATDALRREQHIANLIAIVSLHRHNPLMWRYEAKAAENQLRALGVLNPETD